MYVRRDESLGGGFADGADAQSVQLAHILVGIREAREEVFDGVGAGEDEPVVAEEIVNRFVELRVGGGRDDLDGRAGDDARAEGFKLGREVPRPARAPA